MRCPYPISIPNPAISQNVIVEYRQDGTLLTSLGEILEPRSEVPCGHCMVCLENRREDWATRMECESRTAAQTLFVTLTYSPEYCPDELNLLAKAKSDDMYKNIDSCMDKLTSQLKEQKERAMA